MSIHRSRHLVQLTATRVKRGEVMGAGYLNTCKHRDAALAEGDVWEFEAHPIMLRGDDTDALFGAADCAHWGQEADRLLTEYDRVCSGVAATECAPGLDPLLDRVTFRFG